MKRLIIALLLGLPLAAQFTSTARHIAPGSSLPATCRPNNGDVYFLTAGGPVGTLYICTATNTWTAVGTGTGTASITRTVVTFSATPTFTCASHIQEFEITLTGNITAPSQVGCVAGDYLTYRYIQDGTGNRTVVFPTGFSNACTVSPTANVETKQLFYWDGSNAVPQGPCTSTDTATLIQGPTRAAPGTPATATLNCWFDSTDNTQECKDPSANVTKMVTVPVPATSGGTGLSSLGANIPTWLGMPSSANLAAALTDEVGTGSVVFSATSGGSLAANMPWKCTGNSGGTGVNYVCTATLFDGTAIDLSLRDAPVQTQQLVFVPDADSVGSVAIQIGTNNRAARRTTGGNFAGGALKANNPYVFSWGPANRWYHAGSFSLTSPNGTVTITGTQFDPGIDITNPILSGTTAAIGGGLLAAGACTAETTTTVTGATTLMVASASPSAVDGTLASAQWPARVSAADTVAVKVCLGLAGTPTAEIYNVRVIP